MEDEAAQVDRFREASRDVRRLYVDRECMLEGDALLAHMDLMKTMCQVEAALRARGRQVLANALRVEHEVLVARALVRRDADSDTPDGAERAVQRHLRAAKSLIHVTAHWTPPDRWKPPA